MHAWDVKNLYSISSGQCAIENKSIKQCIVWVLLMKESNTLCYYSNSPGFNVKLKSFPGVA